MDASQTTSETPAPNDSFGPVHIIEPTSNHTHTIILLHGRGSTGPEFADELYHSTLSDGKSLFTKLPGCRFVSPSSKELYSSIFEENIPAWFEAHSLTDITTRQDLQVVGIKDSVAYISTLIDEEANRLDGDLRKLALVGISMGGAIALLSLLRLRNPRLQLGAIVVGSSWLPFAQNVERILAERQRSDAAQKEDFDPFVQELLDEEPKPEQSSISGPPTCGVFIGHGVDDAYVDVMLGRQAAHVLTQAGFQVEWKEYSGAEEEGHWFKVPEQMDDIFDFLTRQLRREVDKT